VCDETWIGGLVVFVVATAITQAQVAVDGSADHIGIAVILPIVLPPADLAEFLDFGHGQCFVTATLAARSSRTSHGPIMLWFCTAQVPRWLQAALPR
jgi:hypothetical protein